MPVSISTDARAMPCLPRSADVACGVQDRVEAVLAAERFQDAQAALLGQTEGGMDQLRLAVLAARELLPDVVIAGERWALLAGRAQHLCGSGADINDSCAIALIPPSQLTNPQLQLSTCGCWWSRLPAWGAGGSAPRSAPPGWRAPRRH